MPEAGDHDEPAAGDRVARGPIPLTIEGPAGGSLTLGLNGWALWRDATGVQARVLIDTTRPRIVITGVAVLADTDRTPNATVRASDLRKVPLGRIEGLLNGPGTAELVRTHLGDEGPRPAPVDFSPGVTTVPDEVPDAERFIPPRQDYRIPGGLYLFQRTDAFHDLVAAAWTRALAEGHTNPARVIGDANQVDSQQVHSWVRTARRRGVLPPSSRAMNAGTRSNDRRKGTAPLPPGEMSPRGQQRLAFPTKP